MPKKNVALTIDIGLVDAANRPNFKSSPTLAAGDFKISKDGGNYANLGTLPTVVNSGKVVRVAFAQSEMNADTITLVASDASGAEWDDQMITFNTTANSIDDVYTAVQSVLSKMLKYFQLALRKDAAIATDNATELTAINASGGSGGGGYVSTTDSQEAIRDNVLTDKTGFKLASDGLDSIATTQPVAERPANFREWLMWLCRRWGNRHVQDKEAGTIVVRNDADSANLSSQPYTATATSIDVGPLA